MRSFRFLAVGILACVLVGDGDVHAYINQVDGTVVVPETSRMQQCLDRSGTGETTAGALNAVEDARVLPESFRPVPNGSGSYDVTFVDIGEGAGFRNLLWLVLARRRRHEPREPANHLRLPNLRHVQLPVRHDLHDHGRLRRAGVVRGRAAHRLLDSNA
ncbi:MAG: hypothetical protein R3B99_29650 [Polyangiales bacterium]